MKRVFFIFGIHKRHSKFFFLQRLFGVLYEIRSAFEWISQKETIDEIYAVILYILYNKSCFGMDLHANKIMKPSYPRCLHKRNALPSMEKRQAFSFYGQTSGKGQIIQ